MISYSHKRRAAANYLKTVYFDHPDWVPCAVNFLPATWIKYREDLEELVLSHPRVFPGFRKGQVDFDFKSGFWLPTYELGRHTDSWGVVWENIQRGCDSIVAEEPLTDWSAFAEWKKRLPDPDRDDWFGPRNWDAVRGNIETARRDGNLAWAGPLMHGHFFMQFEGLYLPEGGLMLKAECGPDVPLANIDAICRVLERLCRLPDAAAQRISENCT